MTSILINLAFGGSLLALFGFIVNLYLPWRTIRAISIAVLALAGGANLGAIVVRWVEAGHPPLVSRYETLILLGFSILVSILVLELARPTPGVAVLGTALALVTLAVASFRRDTSIEPLFPALKSDWLVVHVISYFISYGALTVAFGASVLALGSRLWAGGSVSRSSGAASLADLGHRLVTFGFPFLTLGLVTGSVWAQRAWASYWSWDPKETWSLVTWLFYLAYLHLPVAFPDLVHRGRPTARGSVLLSLAQVIAFLALVFTFLGLRYLPTAAQSLHLYGHGPSPL